MTESRYLAHGEGALRDAAALAVDYARRLSADECSATARAGGGVRITVREGATETAQRDGFQSLDCTVYRDGRHGSASTAALDAGSIRRAVEEALTIAAHVQPDPFAGLADSDLLAHEVPAPPLFAPSSADPTELVETALAIELAAAGRPAPAGVEVRVTEAGVATSDNRFALATSTGFCRSNGWSSHGRWAMVLARDAGGAVQDHAETSDRRPERLDDIARVAACAMDRTVAQLGARTIASRRAPVILDPRVAPELVWDIVSALSGGPQYRRASFLLDAIDTPIAAAHVDLTEDPAVPFGMASGAFDGEGVAGTRRRVISGGVAHGYFLSTTTARRLGRRSTGNAGGPWNLSLSTRLPGGDAPALRRTMGTGLVVTQLLGGATDPVSGNWTRAVSGFWVEGGEIVHPVRDVTLGGRMDAMLHGIVAIGDDVRRSGAVTTGSVLLDDMQIGGVA